MKDYLTKRERLEMWEVMEWITGVLGFFWLGAAYSWKLAAIVFLIVSYLRIHLQRHILMATDDTL